MKTISEIKSEFAAADIIEYPSLYQRYEEDSRSGVKKLIKKRQPWKLRNSGQKP